MTMTEMYKLMGVGSDLPSPNEIIDLRYIGNIKFYNTSFREYLGFYNGYILGVYPFAVKIEKAFRTDGVPVSYELFKIMGVRSSLHHNDFIGGKIEADPCDVYELISGTKIHNGGSDSHLMNINHTDAIREFESVIISVQRNSKLKELGI